MIDICGNIKITSEQRFGYLIACIRSYYFLKGKAKFVLKIEGLNSEQFNIVRKELHGFNYTIVHGLPADYGKAYCELLNEGINDFVINFMEDQFMILNDSVWLAQLLRLMKQESVEVCKASFHKIELNSSKTIVGERNTFGLIYDNNEDNFREYKRHYGERYYIGVNFITSKSFAYSFWNRNFGERPHGFELAEYNGYYNHKCIIPLREIQCAIDDNHGQKGTCLLERNEQKYISCASYLLA